MPSLSEAILKAQPPENVPSMEPAIWRRGFREGLRAAAQLAATAEADWQRERERLRGVIERHYPLVAGRVIALQQSGETVAESVWAKCAHDFHSALEKASVE